jgi:predicted Ser/Thr protein kinase
MSELSFARIALGRGFVTADRLREALAILERIEQTAGIRESLGEILLKKGWLTPGQLGELNAALGTEGAATVIPGYEILGVIGRGAMGTVYKARPAGDPEAPLVALKTLRPGFAEEKDAVERFRRESQALRTLHHPHVVRAIDAGCHNGVFFCVMEYAEGESLAQMIRKRGRVPWPEAVRILKAVAFALDHVARAGIVHRDIKPDNLIVSPEGKVKITDLGLSKIVSGSFDDFLTQAGVVLGTPSYMSPEQVEAKGRVDVRSDIYSLGMTVYAALAGGPAYRDPNPMVVLRMHLDCEPPQAPLVEAGAPPRLVEILRKMTRRDPAERYQTPNELLEDVMGFEARIVPATPTTPVRRPGRRRGLWFAALGLVVTAGVGASILLSGALAGSPPAAVPAATPGNPDAAELRARVERGLDAIRREDWPAVMAFLGRPAGDLPELAEIRSRTALKWIFGEEAAEDRLAAARVTSASIQEGRAVVEVEGRFEPGGVTRRGIARLRRTDDHGWILVP